MGRESMRRDYGTMEGGRVKHALFFCSLDGMSDPADTYNCFWLMWELL